MMSLYTLNAQFKLGITLFLPTSYFEEGANNSILLMKRFIP
jgi:hypothetical protein